MPRFSHVDRARRSRGDDFLGICPGSRTPLVATTAGIVAGSISLIPGQPEQGGKQTVDAQLEARVSSGGCPAIDRTLPARESCCVQRGPAAYLTTAAAATVVYLAAPWSIPAIGVQYIAHELAAAAAIVIAVRRRRPAWAAAWWLLAATLLVWAVGDVFWYRDAARGVSHFPSVADGMYLAGYAILSIALFILGSRTGRTRSIGDVLDALLVTVGLGVPIWVIAVGPAWATNDDDLGGQLVGTAYAAVVLILLFLLSWWVFGGALRAVSGRLLSLGVLALITANLGYSVELLEGLYDPGQGLDAGWLAFFAFSAAAALHRSMSALAPASAAPGAHRHPQRRIAFVWAVVNIPPLMILHEVAWGENRSNLLLVAAIGTLLAVSIMAVRVLDLLARERRAARSESEQRLHALVERIQDVISLHDRSGGLIWCSPAIRHLWGFETAPTHLVGLIDHPDREKVRLAFRDVVAAKVGTQQRVEANIETPAAGRREVELTLVNQLETPSIRAIVVTFHDVTLRAAKRRELEEQALEQAHLAAQLERLQEMKDAFLTAVSHDLRTPLTSIRGMSELLAVRGDAFEPGQREQLIGRIAANAERLEKLLLELLDLDRLTRGIRRPNRDLIDVDDLAREIVAQEEFQAAPVELVTDRVTADVDAAMIASILTNLLGNAVKHNPPGTTVAVRVEAHGEDGVCIVVEDDGRGIPEDLRDQVVEPFARLEESRTTEGSGLGLALVDTFTRLHGGRFRIESRSGGGTRCIAELPAATALPRTSTPP